MSLRRARITMRQQCLMDTIMADIVAIMVMDTDIALAIMAMAIMAMVTMVGITAAIIAAITKFNASLTFQRI
jgi:hypothetical protein